MKRTDRWLPWLLALCMATILLLGVAWDAAYELLPTDTEAVAVGASRIRSVKVEVRDRVEEEHCFGAAGGSGCVTNSGFHRIGSAKAFYNVTTPTNLANPGASALGANDGGRLWIDVNGPDNVVGNQDDNASMFWDTGTLAWGRIGFGGLRNVDLTTVLPVSGSLLRYNGTNWVPATSSTLIAFDRATFQVDETFVNNACAGCTVAGVPDHAGGSDTNGYPEVTVPSTPAGVVWDIYVEGHVTMAYDSGDGTGVGCEVEQDINDADTFGTTRTAAHIPKTPSGGQASECIFSAVLRAATAGSLYSFRVRMDGFNANEDWTVEDAAVLQTAYEQTSEIRVEVRPRALF